MKLIKILMFLFAFPLFSAEHAEADFERLMGKGGAAWKFVQTSEDFSRLNYFKKNFDDTIKHLHSAAKNKHVAIPKVIHFIWLGSDEISEKSLKRIGKWIKRHPTWTFKFWSDVEEREAPFPSMIKQNVKEFNFQILSKPFELADNQGEKAKILSYEILLQEGGICMDHDVSLCKNLDLLNETYDFYCALELLGPSSLSTSVYAATHLVAAKAHHPVIEETAIWLRDHWKFLEEAFPGSAKPIMMHRVKQRSFWALSAGIDKALNTSSNRDMVFPSAFFSSAKRRASSYATHGHEGTWHQHPTDFEIKVASQFQQLVEKNNQAIWIVLLLSGVSLSGWIFLWGSMRRQYD